MLSSTRPDSGAQNQKASEITVICGRCHDPIAPGEGSVYLSYDEHHKAQQYQAKEESRRRAGGTNFSTPDDALEQLEARASWAAAHYGCGREPTVYERDVEDVSTYRGLLDVTNDLYPSWLVITDWRHGVERALRNGFLRFA